MFVFASKNSFSLIVNSNSQRITCKTNINFVKIVVSIKRFNNCSINDIKYRFFTIIKLKIKKFTHNRKSSFFSTNMINASANDEKSTINYFFKLSFKYFLKVSSFVINRL